MLNKPTQSRNILNSIRNQVSKFRLNTSGQFSPSRMSVPIHYPSLTYLAFPRLPLFLILRISISQILVKRTSSLNSLANMIPLQSLGIELSQLSGGGHGISNLPTIHLVKSQFVHVGGDTIKVNIMFVFAEHVKEVLPNLSPAGQVKSRVVEGDLNPRLECLVEYPDSVRGKDQHAVVVFEDSEED